MGIHLGRVSSKPLLINISSQRCAFAPHVQSASIYHTVVVSNRCAAEPGVPYWYCWHHQLNYFCDIVPGCTVFTAHSGSLRPMVMQLQASEASCLAANAGLTDNCHATTSTSDLEHSAWHAGQRCARQAPTTGSSAACRNCQLQACCSKSCQPGRLERCC
jgi:hypothetical protein